MTMRKKSLAIGSSTTLLGGSVGAMLLALAASPASATTTYTVDDLSDGAPNAADCTTPVAGSCSLRDAIAAGVDGDTIVFASGVTGTITLAGSQLDVSDDLTIIGPGASNLTIDADGQSRVFYMTGALDLTGVTITGGSAGRGGGLYDEGGSGIILREVVVTGNEATNGGGGGLYGGGDVLLIRSSIVNNTSSGSGGGAMVGGALQMTRSTIDGNTASAGGGAYAKGNIAISYSTFDSNYSGNCGGGLYARTSNGEITVLSSTFSNNISDGCYGGGIDVDGNNNTVLIANSTITGNQALSGADGGGLHFDGGNDVVLAQDTIVGNTATSTSEYYSGGGVHFANDIGSVTITGTIVSGNSAAAGPADIGFGYDGSGAGAITADDSLLGEVDARLTVNGTGNVSSTSPGVGALADNGGLTKTMALLTGSLAIDAGPATVYPFYGNIYDQRGEGFARVVGTRADIGAFEVQAAPEPTTTTTQGTDPVVPSFTG